VSVGFCRKNQDQARDVVIRIFFCGRKKFFFGFCFTELDFIM
jgi:hypothetical protein